MRFAEAAKQIEQAAEDAFLPGDPGLQRLNARQEIARPPEPFAAARAARRREWRDPASARPAVCSTIASP